MLRPFPQNQSANARFEGFKTRAETSHYHQQDLETEDAGDERIIP